MKNFITTGFAGTLLLAATTGCEPATEAEEPVVSEESDAIEDGSGEDAEAIEMTSVEPMTAEQRETLISETDAELEKEDGYATAPYYLVLWDGERYSLRERALLAMQRNGYTAFTVDCPIQLPACANYDPNGI